MCGQFLPIHRAPAASARQTLFSKDFFCVLISFLSCHEPRTNINCDRIISSRFFSLLSFIAFPSDFGRSAGYISLSVSLSTIYMSVIFTSDRRFCLISYLFNVACRYTHRWVLPGSRIRFVPFFFYFPIWGERGGVIYPPLSISLFLLLSQWLRIYWYPIEYPSICYCFCIYLCVVFFFFSFRVCFGRFLGEEAGGGVVRIRRELGGWGRASGLSVDITIQVTSRAIYNSRQNWWHVIVIIPLPVVE